MNTKQWVTLIVVAVVFAGIGFFWRDKIQQSKTPRLRQEPAGGRAAGFAGRRTGTARSQYGLCQRPGFEC